MKKFTIAAIIFLTYQMATTQNYKFGKVSKDELLEKFYPNDSSVNASILYRNVSSKFDYTEEKGFYLVTQVHERIKIYNKEGFNWATKAVNLYRTGKSREELGGLKAYTYNLEGDKILKTKLEKSGMFTENVSKNLVKEKFTAPNLKPGSVIEFKYTKSSSFLFNIDRFRFQEKIPIKKVELKFIAPEYFVFKAHRRGWIFYDMKKETKSRTMRYTSTSSAIRTGTSIGNTSHEVAEFKEYTYTINLSDVVAVDDEAYSGNLNNYMASVKFELERTDFKNGRIKNYARTWEEVVKTINKSNDFGEQLKKTKFLMDDAEYLRSMGTEKEKIVNNVFNFVKNRMSWNGNYGKYTRKGIEKAYNERAGNVSEINLLLVTLLRECGVKANPVLVSTRNHGVPVFPTLEGFNYVIACAEIGGKDIVLDATDKLNVPGVLPERVLNWHGTLVLDDGLTRNIRLFPTKASQENTVMSVNINNDGSLDGKLRSSYTSLKALEYRTNFKNITKDEYTEILVNTYNLDDVQNLETTNLDDLYKPAMESFTFETGEGVDVIGNEMYISPLFFLKLESNPFKLNERNYPVDFIYPRSRKKIINIKIPESYQVTSLPKPIKVSLPDGMGSFLFNISEVAGGLNVMTVFKINSALIPAHKYSELKEFYNQRILKEAEKVVITKS
jgi:uncharacterized protein DUF3857